MDVLFADEAPAQKAGGLKIQLFGDFLTDAAPLRGLRSDFSRLDDLFNDRQVVGNIERPLVVLLAAVGFVLLIACANLANLMLGRTAARRKELAIRTALGAERGRLIRQIVTEAFVLALVGGAFGVLLASWATRFFVAIGGDSIPRHDAIAMDGRVLGFAALVATISALVAGLVPAPRFGQRGVVI